MRRYNSWRSYQKGLQKRASRERLVRKGLWVLTLVGGVSLLVWVGGTGIFSEFWAARRQVTRECEGKISPVSTLGREELKNLLNREALTGALGSEVTFQHSGRLLTAESTLDSAFQSYMAERIGRSRSLMAGVVAVDPETGHVLCMTETNKTDEETDICLDSRFPAASVFKIVAAAAAIDRRNFSADTKLSFNGRSHTLYKNQLTNKVNRYTNRVTLRDCFAKSINPAFGKLGMYELKQDLLAEYAKKFGFNEPIGFELPVGVSRISLDDDGYHLAEIACGFNRETLISPLHGALLAAVIVNGGKLMSPAIVDFVVDSQKTPVYVSGDHVVRQVISSKTCEEMKELMGATISYGTGRRAFRGYRRDRVLSKLFLGGKTGSIKNDTDQFFYDWFVGFGEQRKGEKKLALAVLVVHGELLRARAHEYARLAFKYYFGHTDK